MLSVARSSQPPSDGLHLASLLDSNSLQPSTTRNLSSSHKLTVYHINSNSLRSHIEYIKLFVSQHSLIHIIAVTETWLGPTVEDSLILLEGYSLLRNDRNTHGGGVALYVHQSLTVSTLGISSHDWTGRPGLPEYIYCEVKPKGADPIFVAVVYRPPHSPLVTGSDVLSSMADLMHGYSTKIILGDFNADQASNSADAQCVRSFIRQNSLYSIPYLSTHHTPTSDTWLDLCLVDSLDVVDSYWRSDVPFIAGHDVIMATLQLNVHTELDQSFSYRDFKSVNPVLLNDYLLGCDWSVIESRDASLETKLDCLYEHLLAALDSFAPVLSCVLKRNHHPWFTPTLRQLIAERDRLYRRYRRSRLPLELLEYRRARDLAHEKIEIARLE